MISKFQISDFKISKSAVFLKSEILKLLSVKNFLSIFCHQIFVERI